MKKVIYLILSTVLFVSFYNCSPNNQDTNAQDAKTVIRDTVYLYKEAETETKCDVFSYEYVGAIFYTNPSSLTNILYLTMDRMFRGKIWNNEQGGYFFYRLLFASVGDAEFLFVEKIDWIEEEEGKEFFKLVSRFRITKEHFNGNWWYDGAPKVEWISPTVVKLSFATDNWEDRSEKEFYLDLAKLEILK